MRTLMAFELLLLLWTALLFLPLRWRPVGLILFVPRLFAQALTPLILVLGILTGVVGALAGWWWHAAVGALVAAAAAIVVARVGGARPAHPPRIDGRAAGPPAATLARRWRGPLPRVPEPRLRQDVTFATVPSGNRPLLLDLWQPAAGVAPSGTGIVYLHSSAWSVFDKDAGTRPLFRQLTAQGHVVADVAYRLYPETDMPGMVADGKRAVAWLKQHGRELGVDPGRIVLAGGSAGGHLALLTGYTADDPALGPPELAGTDLTVAGVAALYAPTDLAAMFDHTSQATSTSPDDPKPDWDAPPPGWAKWMFGDDAQRFHSQSMMAAGRFDWLVGGRPDELPGEYERLSPLHRVHAGCPPTLLVHGVLDMMAPVGTTRELERRLREAGRPVTAVYLPHTDHAFDLVLPRWAPPARASIHALERFLAAPANPTESHLAVGADSTVP